MSLPGNVRFSNFSQSRETVRRKRLAVVMEKVGMIGKENSTLEVVTKKDLEVEKQDKDMEKEEEKQAKEVINKEKDKEDEEGKSKEVRKNVKEPAVIEAKDNDDGGSEKKVEEAKEPDVVEEVKEQDVVDYDFLKLRICHKMHGGGKLVSAASSDSARILIFGQKI